VNGPLNLGLAPPLSEKLFKATLSAENLMGIHHRGAEDSEVGMDLGLGVMVMVSVVLSHPQRQGNARAANRDLQTPFGLATALTLNPSPN